MSPETYEPHWSYAADLPEVSDIRTGRLAAPFMTDIPQKYRSEDSEYQINFQGLSPVRRHRLLPAILLAAAAVTVTHAVDRALGNQQERQIIQSEDQSLLALLGDTGFPRVTTDDSQVELSNMPTTLVRLGKERQVTLATKVGGKICAIVLDVRYRRNPFPAPPNMGTQLYEADSFQFDYTGTRASTSYPEDGSASPAAREKTANLHIDNYGDVWLLASRYKETDILPAEVCDSVILSSFTYYVRTKH